MKKEPTEEELKQIEIAAKEQDAMFEYFDSLIADMIVYEEKDFTK